MPGNRPRILRKTENGRAGRGFRHGRFLCARREHVPKGESPESARQREGDSEGRRVHREVESEGSRMLAANSSHGPLFNSSLSTVKADLTKERLIREEFCDLSIAYQSAHVNC